jgi:hypothetical protein
MGEAPQELRSVDNYPNPFFFYNLNVEKGILTIFSMSENKNTSDE